MHRRAYLAGVASSLTGLGGCLSTVPLLGEPIADVEVVDTLESLDEFRGALERHSGRETIPQTFVDGEFVGGSDILEQLHEQGDLEETLQA
jgi:monothiol glutaredoxin